MPENQLSGAPLLSKPQIADDIGLVSMVQVVTVADVVAVRDLVIDPANAVPVIVRICQWIGISREMDRL